jgi:anti-anti-sigma factor
MSTSLPPANILVRVVDRAACVRICGRANFNSSMDFKVLISELQSRGCRHFILDLRQCVLMDSTFLGVLAGFGAQAMEEPVGATASVFELFHPTPRVVELLESLGVLHLFKLNDGDTQLPEDFEPHEAAAPANASREEVTRTCLEAHQKLAEINPANADRFKDVTRFLMEDLKKMQGGGGN